MSITAVVASLPSFGKWSPVLCSSVASKGEGAVSSFSTVGIRFPARRRTSVSREYQLSHHGRGPMTAHVSITALAYRREGGEGREKVGPTVPDVHVDHQSDPAATIVELSFGTRPSRRLGGLLETTKALKNLGLNVVKGRLSTDEDSPGKNRFYVTCSDNGSKVDDSEVLETIRLTIIYNLLNYHLESSELYFGRTFGLTPLTHPKGKLDVDIATKIRVEKVNPKVSVLSIETANRPGLLLDILKVITDMSVMVESAVIETEGLLAKDQFYVSYGGAALSKSLEGVLTNCLRYWHIRKARSC